LIYTPWGYIWTRRLHCLFLPGTGSPADEVERMTESRWRVLLVLAASFSMHGVECMAADADPTGTSATAPASGVATVEMVPSVADHPTAQTP
jgi:hypothetical protein